MNYLKVLKEEKKVENHPENLGIVSSCLTGDGYTQPTALYSNQTKCSETFSVVRMPDKFKGKTIDKGPINFSISLNQPDLSHMHEVICPAISFTIPPLLYKNLYDTANYCDKHGLYLIKSVSLHYDGQRLETLDTLGLDAANKIFLGNNYDYCCNKYFGGIDGPFQKTHRVGKVKLNQTITTKQKAILIPKSEITVFLPFEIFRNPVQLWPLRTSGPCEFQLNVTFNLLRSICTYSNRSVFDLEISDFHFDLFMCVGCFNE